MQTSIGFSVPRDFVNQIDRVAASLGLNRSKLCMEALRRAALLRKDAPLTIQPSNVRFATGNRRVIGFRCSDQFREAVLSAADARDIEYSEFIFFVLREYILERMPNTKERRAK